MLGRDMLAGALLYNAMPHAIMGLARKRCLTPLRGPNSGPAANLAWSALNLAAGTALLATGWRGIDQATASSRLARVGAGSFVMAAFGMVYELTRRLDTGPAPAVPRATGAARERPTG